MSTKPQLKPSYVPSTKPVITVQLFADDLQDIEVQCKEMKHTSFVSFEALGKLVADLLKEAFELREDDNATV